jgi:hypothetical protein
VASAFSPVGGSSRGSAEAVPPPGSAYQPPSDVIVIDMDASVGVGVGAGVGVGVGVLVCDDVLSASAAGGNNADEDVCGTGCGGAVAEDPATTTVALAAAAMGLTLTGGKRSAVRLAPVVLADGAHPPPPHPLTRLTPSLIRFRTCFCPLLQTTTICLLNKQVSRVLLQNQTFMTTIRTVYAGQAAAAAVSPGSLAALGMPRTQFLAFVQVCVPTCAPLMGGASSCTLPNG